MLAPDRTLSVLPPSKASRLSYARLRAPTRLPRLNPSSALTGGSALGDYLRRLVWRFGGV